MSAHATAVATIKREAQEQVQRLIEQITLARQRQFGTSSELTKRTAILRGIQAENG